MAKTITYVNNQDTTATLTMTWTALKTKLDSLGSDAGEYFYNARWTLFDGEGNPIPWTSLTGLQKLDVLLKEVTFHLRSGAFAQYTTTTIQTAKDGMETAEEKYDMED